MNKRLSFKAVLAKILNSIASPITETTTQVTLPYKAPNDGLFISYLRSNAAGRCYETYSGVACAGINDFYSAGQTYNSVMVPVKRGNTVKATGSSNVRDRLYYFVTLSPQK